MPLPKFVLDTTGIKIYGYPTLKQLEEILGWVRQRYSNIYDNLPIITGLQDPFERGLIEFLYDQEKGVSNPTKDYFPGCNRQEVENRLRQLKEQNASQQS
ncbi:hypothetical protein [Nostoc sp.]|uniref:hypothetical protein n=1 Tax=Nostoc sp. TaxID=1180 RepID=UPI002FF69D49